MTKDASITPNSKGWDPCTRAGKKTKYLSPVSHNMTVGDINDEGGYACLRVGGILKISVPSLQLCCQS